MSSDHGRDVREGSLRQEIVRIGRMMYDGGLLSGFEGNLSTRLGGDRILVTPSGLHKGMLRPEQLLVVDAAGRLVGYPTEARRGLRPTSELPMHLEAYRQRPDVLAVVHAHPSITVALSIAGVPMDTPLLPEVIVLLGVIPTAPYAMSSSEEGAAAIRELIRRHDAIILQRHGTLTVGDSLTQAFMRLETVEQNARIHYMLAQLGAGEPLEGNELRKLLLMRRGMGLEREGDTADYRRHWGIGLEGADRP
jgi:L-fuculose-phosphate aldolase